MKINKIALFLPSLAGGGAERIFVTLANSLTEQGIQIDLVLSNATGKYFSFLDHRISVINLHAKSVVFSIPNLIKYLRKNKPDVLLSAIENANTWAIIANKLSRTQIPIIITEHINWSQINANQPPTKEKILFQVARLAYPHADWIISVSNGIRADLIKTMGINPNHITSIYNPVVPPNLLSLSNQTVNHPWFINKDTPVIISIGRLSKQKGFDTLIHSFNIVRKNIKCRMIILGEGEERRYLESLIERLGLGEEIDMPGFVDNPYSWLSKSDLFVLSSNHEGLPTVLIESMACGTPVVSTDCISGPAEILQNGKYGELVPVGDIESMANAIIKNLSKSIAKNQLVQRANEFSVSNATTAYIDTIQHVIKTR